jgi:fumarate hydratase class I
MPTRIDLPVTAERVRALRAGDEVLVSGRLVTARAAGLRRLAAQPAAFARGLLEGRFLYHCGPVVAPDGARRGWRFVAAGPSPSLAAEPFQAELLATSGLRGVLGKGGMGPRTLAALVEHGAVYLHVAGSLAVTLARRVVRVHGVHLLDELGTTDALWEIEVEGFPAVVSMDAHGESLHGGAASGVATGPAGAGA